MNYTLIVLFSFSISIAAIIGWIRFKKINPAYYPFLCFVWIGLLNEILSFIITRSGHSTAVNNNIYVLIESLLITMQFRNWGLFKRSKNLFPAILILFLVIWIIDGFFISRLTVSLIYFRIAYSFIIVLMSVNMINSQLIGEKRNILRNSIFLICLAFLFYFTYKLIFWAFLLYGLTVSRQFMMALLAALTYINLFANLIYAFAVLWMPTKHRFSLPS